MDSKRLKTVRVMAIVMLAMLAVQYEFGMIVNMSNPQPIAPFPFSIPAISDALHAVSAVAVLHASWGGLLVLLAIVTLVLSLASRVRPVQIFGSLGLLSILFAATGGVLFVLSGFQYDGASHSMATNFLLAFSFYFLELYFLKPAPGTH